MNVFFSENQQKLIFLILFIIDKDKKMFFHTSHLTKIAFYDLASNDIIALSKIIYLSTIIAYFC